MSDKKTICFEYILIQLVEWYSSMNPDDKELLSLTRLKVLKLLFFISAVKQDDGSDLLDIFDNYYAMQHGPVESDIYNNMTSKLNFYSFEGRYIKQTTTVNIDKLSLSKEEKDRLDKSIISLKKKNENLILYCASKLVSLSHRWNSWQTSFAIADVLGRGSEKMSGNLIRKDNQDFII